MRAGWLLRRGSVGRGAAAFAATLAALLVLAVAAEAASFNSKTQSHPGACSQSTTNVSRAVTDLHANGVLAHYAALLGVRATRSAMTRALAVGHVVHAVTTDNHGCQDGTVFDAGLRHLYKGETVGVKVPAKLRGLLCSGPGGGCKREVIVATAVFPTNCWNENLGRISVAVYAKLKPAKPAVAKPAATASLECDNGGESSAGTIMVELSNGASATKSAVFSVSASGNESYAYGPYSYGPVAPGQSQDALVPVDSTSTGVELTVTSGGKTVLQDDLNGCETF